MLRLDARNAAGEYQPLAALSSFSIHGTAVPRYETLYNADLWAYLERELEWHMRTQFLLEWAPVHGACQGTHGDVAPAVENGKPGFPEAHRIGQGLATKPSFCSIISPPICATISPSVQDYQRQVDCYQSLKQAFGLPRARRR